MFPPKSLRELYKIKHVNKNRLLPGKNGLRKEFDVPKHSFLRCFQYFFSFAFSSNTEKVGDWELCLSSYV